MTTMFNRILEAKQHYATYIGDGDSLVESSLKNKMVYQGAITRVDRINHKIKVRDFLQ